MQWKVIRDQVNMLGEKQRKLDRYMQEINESVASHKHEFEAKHDRLRYEVRGLVDDAKDIARQELMQALERTEALAHVIHAERNAREMAVQGVERQVQGARDAIDLDRSSRRKDAETCASLLENHHKELLHEISTREALEDRHKMEMRRLTERIEELPRLQSEPLHELGEELKKAQVKFSADYDETSRSLMMVRSIAESVQYEGSMRQQDIDRRMQVVEERIAQSIARSERMFDELRQRTLEMAESAEQRTLEQRGRDVERDLQGVMAAVQDLGKESVGASVSFEQGHLPLPSQPVYRYVTSESSATNTPRHVHTNVMPIPVQTPAPTVMAQRGAVTSQRSGVVYLSQPGAPSGYPARLPVPQ